MLMSSEILLNSEKIIERLKNLLKLQSETQLAKYLGINQSTLASWKSNNNFDVYRVFDKIKHINLNWLLTGEGSPDGTLDTKKDRDKLTELENELKKTDTTIEKDNKEIARLESEISELRAKLNYADSIINRMIKVSN